ncbi:MAG TPA: hypothetical protein DCX07_15770 [Phycisphaerales bacterium]|nr:hypothetical protein [Phycisphaerales bacterium]
MELTYLADGNTHTRKDQRGSVRTFGYDDLGRLTSDAVTTAGTGVDTAVLRIGRAYDDRGRAFKVTSYDAASGGNVVNEVKRHYDDWGAVSRSYQAHAGAVDDDGEGGDDTPSVQYAYESDSSPTTYIRLDKITYPAGREVYYNYPASGVGSVLSRIDNVADDGSGTTKYVQYTYLGAGVIVKAAHPSVTGGLNLSYGTAGTYGGWDRFGRVTDQNWSNDSPAVKDRFRYGYDRNSNRTWRENYEARQQSAALDEHYTYDGLDRLTNVDRGTLSGTHPSYSAPASPTLERDYTLNQLGDWSAYVEKTSGSETLAQTRAHNAANEITAIGETTGASWIDPVHDAAGNMTSGPKAGAETTRLHMVYDAWNRLARVYEDDGDGQFEPGGDDTLIATYRYDGRHFRNRRIVGGDTFDYYDNGNWQVLEERKNGSANAQVQYVWDGRYVHSPALRWRDENCDGQDIETLYYTNDANFNVTALIDTSGNVAERYVYDAYGKVTIYNADWSQEIAWANSRKNVVLYTGHKLDPETGLYYGNRRYYHPTLGRWITWDPLGYVDGMSLYEYVTSAPMDSMDPSGNLEYKHLDAEPEGIGSLKFNQIGAFLWEFHYKEGCYWIERYEARMNIDTILTDLGKEPDDILKQIWDSINAIPLKIPHLSNVQLSVDLGRSLLTHKNVKERWVVYQTILLTLAWKAKCECPDAPCRIASFKNGWCTLSGIEPEKNWYISEYQYERGGTWEDSIRLPTPEEQLRDLQKSLLRVTLTTMKTMGRKIGADPGENARQRVEQGKGREFDPVRKGLSRDNQGVVWYDFGD